MKMRTVVALIATHLVVGGLGFVGGMYTLPILTAPPAPTEATIKTAHQNALFKAQFRRNLKDSDALHWGEGVVSVGPDAISLMGELAPGPDYQLYLSPEYIETEADFNQLKPKMVSVGEVKTFNNFLVPVPEGIRPSDFTTVIVWCESFGQFITSAKYQ